MDKKNQFGVCVLREKNILYATLYSFFIIYGADFDIYNETFVTWKILDFVFNWLNCSVVARRHNTVLKDAREQMHWVAIFQNRDSNDRYLKKMMFYRGKNIPFFVVSGREEVHQVPVQCGSTSWLLSCHKNKLNHKRATSAAMASFKICLGRIRNILNVIGVIKS